MSPSARGHHGQGAWPVLMAVVGVAVAITVLQLAGRGDLATPPLHSCSGFRRWLDDRDGITAAFAILRLGALLGAWYVAVALAVGGVARLTRNPTLVALTDAATAAPLRRLLAGAAGAGLAPVAALSVAPAVIGSVQAIGEQATDERQPGGLTDPLVLLPDAGGSPARDRLVLLTGDEGTATMRRLDQPATWTVQPGDHLWRIAESTLADAFGRPPSDAEIVPYWTALIEHNRARLVHRDNPDLILPGQVFELPLPPPAPG